MSYSGQYLIILRSRWLDTPALQRLAFFIFLLFDLVGQIFFN